MSGAEAAPYPVDPDLLANPDHIASAVASVSGADRGRPQRAIDVRVLGGIDLRLLPDRGLDISGGWSAGVPLHWTSRVGEVGPLDDLGGTRWLAAFGGGLLTTCGLRNVGAPAEGHGLHGTFAHLRARDVATTRPTPQRPELSVTGVLTDADALGTHLRCERQVSTALGTPRVTVTDTVTNLGASPEAAPMLYHVNIGAPLWSPGATIEINSNEVLPRDADAAAALATLSQAPQPRSAAPEQVFEHVGATIARIDNADLGLAMTITWNRESMPRLHQWVHPAIGVYALGVEPANCSVLGRAHDRAEDRLPVLQPGESRTTSLTITITR